MGEGDGRVPLAAAISALREELHQAWTESADQNLRFKPAPVELTLQVAVTTGGKGRAGIRWWLVDLGGEFTREASAMQTVKLTLEPVMLDPQGQPVELRIDAPDALDDQGGSSRGTSRDSLD